MGNYMKAYGIICGFALFGWWGVSCLSAQSRPVFGDPGFVLPGGHQGGVNVLIADERGRLLSAGADGFLEIWDLNHRVAEDRFQLSAYPIHDMVLRPGKTQVSLLESDGLGVYRISAWDYGSKRKLFTLNFQDTISSINYSGGGAFLIALLRGRSGLLYIHAETGEIRPGPDIPGAVGFAATGKSERTMISYLLSGVLSYWDLASGREIRHFSVPPQLRSLVLFGNNRFLGGIGAEGLVVIDAVSGALLIRERSISQGILLPLDQESSGFMCLALEKGGAVLYDFTISSTGRLETGSRWTMPRTMPSIISAALTPGGIALGTLNGSVWLDSGNESVGMMQVRNQQRIREAAVSGATLAFITQGRDLGFLPLDYTRLKAQGIVECEASTYTHITTDPENQGETAQFLLWQNDRSRSFPLIRTLDEESGDDPGENSSDDTLLNKLPLRAPLRAAALRGEKALFLDALGNTTLLSTTSGRVLFSFSSIASLDAGFLDDKSLIIGQSVISGNAPFLMVNSITGETLPLIYPASAAVRIYRSSSGILYGVTVDQQPEAVKTAVIRFNPDNPSHSPRIFEQDGEDTDFGITEWNGALGATLGGEGAFFYNAAGKKPLERSPGLPLRLIAGGNYVISLDAEGSIGWYDPQSGKLLALFRLYEDQWILETGRRQVIRGRVQGLGEPTP